MKLVKKLSKKASKKVTKKATKKGGAFGTKRAREENMGGPVDTSTMFNDMLLTIGDENVLYDFAEFLGRPDPKFIIRGDMGYAEWAAFLRESLTDDFCGLVHDGAHWTGYEAKEPNVTRVEYNSYTSDLQISGTANFCQSYAAFLWARKGEFTYNGNGLEIKFVPEKYPENTQEMAKLWLAWAENICKRKALKQWLNDSINQGINEENDKYRISEGYNTQQLKSTLTKISEDPHLAHELAVSKEY